MAETVIRTEHLTKQYGALKAVNDVSIQIERGAIVGLVGQNGAGKTTLIRMLTGLVKPTSGSFELLANGVRTDTDVAAIVERPSLYMSMTAADNLAAQSKLLGVSIDGEYINRTLQLVGLNPSQKQKVKNYSLGMKQRLAIAMTLVGKPQLLILDEPTNGMDPQGIHDIRDIFVRMNREYGVTILISSHILPELSKFATEFYVMDCGRIINHFSADKLNALASQKLRLTVSDVDKAAQTLEQFGKVEKISSTQIFVYTDTPSTQILLSLAQQNVAVTNITQMDDALETLYIDSIKNQHNPAAGGDLHD